MYPSAEWISDGVAGGDTGGVSGLGKAAAAASFCCCSSSAMRLATAAMAACRISSLVGTWFPSRSRNGQLLCSLHVEVSFWCGLLVRFDASHLDPVGHDNRSGPSGEPR